MSKKLTRSARAGSAASRSSDVVAADALALGDRERRQLEHRLGLPPGREAWAMSPPTMKVSSSSGASSCSALRVSTVYDGPPRSSSSRETSRRSSPATAQRGRARSAPRRPGPPATSLCGGARDRHEEHAVEAELRRAPPARRAGAPRCGGLNVPPRMPTRATPAQARTWPVALDQVLERAQLAQADRAAGVQLLRRVADLGAHAELAAVGEARRGVDVDAGRVDAALERARGARRRAVTIASEWPEP